MKEVITLSLALALVCALASGVLAIAESQTKEARQQARLEDQSKALRNVLPPYDNTALEDTVSFEHQGVTVTFFRARQGSELVGLAGQAVSPKGFGGGVEVLVGLETNGAVRKVVVTRHTETPGLGTEVTDRKRTKTITDLMDNTTEASKTSGGLAPNPYLDQFEDDNLAEKTTFTVTKDGGDLQAVSGATISSRAVADAVTKVAHVFSEYRTEIMSAAGPAN